MGRIFQFVALTIFLGVIQICTSNPIVPGEETDVTKMFTADELQRAKSVGIRDRELINGVTRGVTVDEMIKLYILQKSEPVVYEDYNDTSSIPPITFKEMSKLCEIFVPEHKTATNYSSAQEVRLNELWQIIDDFPRNIQFLFIRNSACAYASEPFTLDKCADSFGSNFTSFMKFRFWVLKSTNATGADRVKDVKQVCCVYKGQYNKDKTDTKVEPIPFSLSNDQMDHFDKLWKHFETANTTELMEPVCNYLRKINPSDKC